MPCLTNSLIVHRAKVATEFDQQTNTHRLNLCKIKVVRFKKSHNIKLT